MEIIYNITYKYFDDNDLWSLKMERKYMELFKFQYTESKPLPHRTREKGCFEILACGEKNRVGKTYTENWEEVTREICYN